MVKIYVILNIKTMVKILIIVQIQTVYNYGLSYELRKKITIDVNNVIYVIYCGGGYALFNVIYFLMLFIMINNVKK